MFNQFRRKRIQEMSEASIKRAREIEQEALKELSSLIDRPNASQAAIMNYLQKKTDSTVIMLAAESNCLIGVEWLSYHPDFFSLVGRKNFFGQTALFFALLNCHTQDVYMVNVLSVAGESYEPIINYRHPENGNTFLITAVMRESLTVKKLDYLLKIPGLRRSINKENNMGHTALFVAFIRGNWPVVLLLLKEGASYTALLKFLPPLSVLLIVANHGWVEGIEYLLTIPEFNNALNMSMTPVQYLLTILGVKNALNMSMSPREYLLTIPKIQSKFRRILNTSMGHLFTILKYKDVMSISNTENLTVILIAALAGQWRMVEFLQGFGADPNQIIEYRQEKTQNDILMLWAEKDVTQEMLVLFKIPHFKLLFSQENVFRQTALLIACINGNSVVAEILMKAGAGDLQREVIEFHYDGNCTALMQAIENRSTKGVRYLLSIREIRERIDEENQYGETVLIRAASQGSNVKLPIIQALVEAGASVVKLIRFRMKSGDKDEITILSNLVKYGRIDVVAYLLTRPEFCEPRLDEENQWGLNLQQQLRDALLIATLNIGVLNRITGLNGHWRLVELLRCALIKYLGLENSNLNSHNDPTLFLLDYRDEQGGNLLSKASIEGWGDFLEYLLGAIPSFRKLISEGDNQGRTPLYHGCINGWVKISECLVKHGASIENEVINYRHAISGNTILMECVSEGDLLGLELLLSFKEIKDDINARNVTCQTALWIAVSRRKPNLVRGLIYHGADVETTCQGKDILEYASENPDQTSEEYLQTIAILTAARKFISELKRMVMEEEYICADPLSILLEQGASVYQIDMDHRTLLHLAVRVDLGKFVSANLKVLINELLEHGADPLLPDNFGFNAIDYSCQKNNPIALCTIYLFLIEQKAKEAKQETNMVKRKEKIKQLLEVITDIMTIAEKARHAHHKGYIFLKIGIALKMLILLKILEPTAVHNISINTLMKVPKGSNSYEEAQYELAKSFYACGLNLENIPALERALGYSLRSGFSDNAVILRKEIIGIALGKNFGDKRFDLLNKRELQDFIEKYNSLKDELNDLTKQCSQHQLRIDIDFSSLTSSLEALEPKNILSVVRQCAKLEATALSLWFENSRVQHGRADALNLKSCQSNGSIVIDSNLRSEAFKPIQPRDESTERKSKLSL